MKLLLRGLNSSIKELSNSTISNQISRITKRSFIKVTSYSISNNTSLHYTPKYQFSSSSQQQTPPPQQSTSSSSSIKLLQIKNLFQTQMNKYNLKGLLKMYKILKHNSITLSQQSLHQFQQRLHLQLTNIDHQTVNSLLQTMKNNGQFYQIKGKNKLLRGINMKLQKNKLNFELSHIYKTVRLITEMNFPKSTISRVLYKLLQENQPEKRQLHLIDNLSELKIILLAVEMVEVDLEIKRRAMENLNLIKPKGVVELAYFYSVLKTLANKLQESVLFQAQKKSVYELAFNPYRNYEDHEENGQNQTKNNPSKPQATSPQINPAIMKQLLDQKEKILEETFKKINLQQVSTELFEQLSQIIKNPSQDSLDWKEMKQLCLLLISNRFGEEDKDKRELIGRMVTKVVNEGMEEKVLIRLPEFIIFMQEMKELGSNKEVEGHLKTYTESYYELMNIKEKLMFTYHKSKLLNLSIDLFQLRNSLQELDYGLDSEEFVWLKKVLSFGQEKHSPTDKQLVKEIWTIVEENLDQELEGLSRQKQERESRQTEQKEQKRKQYEESKKKDQVNGVNSTQNKNQK